MTFTIDSSMISALMKKNTNQCIHSFTIKFSEEDQKFEQMPDDSRYARQIAEQFGFDHHEFEIRPDITKLLPKMVWHLDEPLTDPAVMNTYLISKASREQGIVVLLNGMGGDEIFGGYRKQLACLLAEDYQRFVPGFLRKSMESIIMRIPTATSKRAFRSLRWAKRFLSFASFPKYERYLTADLSLTPERFQNFYETDIHYEQTYFYTSQKRHFENNNSSYLTQMCLNDTLVFLPEHNLTYSDKACMAVGVEGRPPLTDHRVVEFMFRLPPSMRIKGLTQKYLLKKVAERYLPRNIVHRPKVPFGAPLRSWIRNDLREIVDDILSWEAIKKRGIFRPASVFEMIRQDREGKEDYSPNILQLLMTELWFRTFFDHPVWKS